ncbi:MAG: DUF1365 domain-containing protein [Solirubrobacterales bacterium]|nr:DUF1365 domain-containing protein [Solirubrobacterales bacterium]MCB0859868.1 DUF1365 domain-containing protein [Solirubrobacterales bacterium]MCB0862812.1 DUF1365 domain-containing protein [Solirubrobacterales bacterium]HRV59788.1 DUF1365 domain-containing protein [Solirubrobacterales bacterium]
MNPGRESAIYEGRIRHRRFEPVEREFDYGIFMLYLDLDELPEVMSIHPLWSTRPRSPAGFRRSDYLGPPDLPLKGAVLDEVERRCGVRPRGPVRMLSHLRYFGVCFNPVTFYYCFDPSGERLETVLLEVTNTPWGERHCYLVDQRRRPRVLAADVAKSLHVSPLMAMDHRYELACGEPDRTLSVHMASRRKGVLHFDATLRMERTEITRARLGRLLSTRLPMPLKVLGGIHLEAARTWLAGARYHPHPEKIREEDLSKLPKFGKLCSVKRVSGSGSAGERPLGGG